VTRPVRCQPHPIFLPRPGQPSQRFSQIAGWYQRPGTAYIVGARPAQLEVPVTREELAAWRARWEATCSDKMAMLLCALERDYGAK